MAKLRSQDYQCTNCGYFEDGRIVKIADGDPYTIEGCPIEDCPECGAEASHAPRFSAANLMSRALPDGTFRGERFQLMKEIAKVESDSLNLPVDRRTEHHHQVARLQTDILKKGLKDKDL